MDNKLYMFNCKAYITFRSLANKYAETNSKLSRRFYLLAVGHREAVKRFLYDDSYVEA